MNNVMQNIKRSVEIDLTGEQIVERAHELAQLHAEAADIQKEISEFTKSKKAEVKTRTDRISQICRIIEAGKEINEVDCEVYKDFERGTVQYHFQGKLVDERAMEDGDRQGNLLATTTPPELDFAEQVFDETFPTVTEKQ